MKNVVSFINMKGGVGKTTLAVNVGYTLSQHFGRRVLLIDADPQMNATQYTLNEEQVREIKENPKKTLYSILSPDYHYPSATLQKYGNEEELDVIFNIGEKFDIIPSHLRIMNLDLDKRTPRLKQYIKENNFRNKYDVIIIDLPPTISTYTTVSLLASDRYLVPMKTDLLSYLGLPLLEDYIYQLKREYELDLEFLGIVFTMVRPDFSIYKEVKKTISERPEWKNKVFKSELKYTTDVEKALLRKEEKMPYLIELSNPELTSQMISITQEFMQRMRL